MRFSITSYKQLILSFLWVWLGVFVCLWFSWNILSKVDFGYSFWYEYGGAKKNIELYAPQNLTHHGFEDTTKSTRLDLFHKISMAIQMSPEQAKKQLSSFSYKIKGQPVTPLLHKDEIIHLVDVSYLLQKLRLIGITLTIIWAILTLWILISKMLLPTIKQFILFISFGLSGVALILVSIGFTKVFYKLHHWVFPEDHPFFFYYQESLMTTLMNAPTLFGQIAVLLLVVDLLLLFAFYKIFNMLACNRNKNMDNCLS